ncbi:MAG: CvpA family protein [Tannerella sp.]|jgi:membrane protein required for colicin V production|nr:CvpA family protein [Tannerella sp.]
MNWLDIVLVIIAAAGLFKGYKDGFIRQIVFFLGLIAAIYLCSKVAVKISEYIIQTGWFPIETVGYIAYILAFILILGIVTMLGWIIHKMISATPLSLFNQLAGAVLGLLVTVLLLSLTLNIMEGLDRTSALISRETKVESRFYIYCRDIVPDFFAIEIFNWYENEVK